MLPTLPKKNQKKEADFGLRFRKFMETTTLPAGSYELKETDGTFPFSEVTEDQVNSALRNKSRKGNLIRVLNGTVGAADYIYLKGSSAWIVIKYPRNFYFIDIENFIAERDRSKRKSLTEDRALCISALTINLR